MLVLIVLKEIQKAFRAEKWIILKVAIIADHQVLIMMTNCL